MSHSCKFHIPHFVYQIGKKGATGLYKKWQLSTRGRIQGGGEDEESSVSVLVQSVLLVVLHAAINIASVALHSPIVTNQSPGTNSHFTNAWQRRSCRCWHGSGEGALAVQQCLAKLSTVSHIVCSSQYLGIKKHQLDSCLLTLY